jgi:DUF1009 family protein
MVAKAESGAAMSGQPHDIAIICGYGAMPSELLAGARAAGRSPFLIRIEGEAEEELEVHPGETLAWGQIGRLFRVLKEHGIGEVVFAGGIHKRPELSRLKLDMGALLSLPKALVFMLGGDNTVLSGVIRLFESKGIRVLGAHQIAPQMLCGQGLQAGRKPAAATWRNISLAFAACKAVGHLDIGQAAIAEGGRVVAVEGVEGTDEMLARIIRMRQIGRMPQTGKQGVLVKTMKPGQDMRADLPAIGPRTIEGVAAAGLTGIVLEAGHSIIIDRAATLAAARQAGLFIYGASEAEAAGNG